MVTQKVLLRTTATAKENSLSPNLRTPMDETREAVSQQSTGVWRICLQHRAWTPTHSFLM